MNIFKFILFPFSCLYWLITSIRNRLFEFNILEQYKSNISIISFGNLNMGGTGKTPHVAFVIEKLSHNNVAVISRGYRRKNKNLIEADSTHHSYEDIGDEPMELLQNFEGENFKVIVEGNRKKALQYLEKQTYNTDLVLLDDGYQHRYVTRDLNILLTDFNCPFYNDFILPYGTLRESKYEAKRADVILVTKCPNSITEEKKNEFKKRIKRYSSADVYFTIIKYHTAINQENKKVTLNSDKKLLLITGIANPKHIYQYLDKLNITYTTIKYQDHHNFSKSDMENILCKSKNFDGIITTEKDWMRLREKKYELINSTEIIRLQIGVQFIDLEQEKKFTTKIKNLLSKK